MLDNLTVFKSQRDYEKISSTPREIENRKRIDLYRLHITFKHFRRDTIAACIK